MPYDIIVTSFDINLYTPFIHEIFGGATKKNYIPYIISNENFLNDDPLFNFFEKILNFSTNNFDIDQIFYFLQMPFLSKKFYIQETEVKLLKNYLKKINIKWGLNNKHLVDISIPCKEYNTWKHGINRILLSYSMSPTKKIWQKIPTYSLSNNVINELIGKLSDFIDTIDKWRQKLKHPKLLKRWYIIIQELIDDFFCKEDTLTSKKLILIEKEWKSLINSGIQNKFTKKINIFLLKAEVFSKIYKKFINQQLFLGSTIFCNLTILRGTPFKVSCILGLNNNIDYYQNKLESFDLMKKHPNIYDPNLKNKYNISILEFFLSAEIYFYSSYIKNINNIDFRINSSLFINSIIDIITKNFFLKGDENIHSKQQSKNIISHICFFHEKNIYLTNRLQNNKPYNSFDTFLHNFLKLSKKSNLKIKPSLKIIDIKKIHLQELIKFWIHPVRYFFNKRLKINLDSIENNKINTEPFQINPLTLHNLNKDIFKTILKQKNINEVFSYYEKSGILPHGNFGFVLFEEHKEKIISLIKELLIIRRYPTNKTFFFQINHRYIYGNISEICESGLIKCLPKTLNYKNFISLWIEHLVYCLLGGKKDSLMLGFNNSKVKFINISVGAAYYYLSNYIEGYILGLNTPLLLTQSGFEWLKIMYIKKTNSITIDNTKKIQALKKLLQIWKGNNYKLGEKEDIYLKKVITNFSDKNIKKICKISKRWTLPILMYKR